MKTRNKKRAFLITAWAFALPAFLLSQISFWHFAVFASDSPEDIQSSIESIQKKLQKEQKAKQQLEKNLGQIQTAVAVTQKSISQTQSVIKQVSNDISQKEQEIKDNEEKLAEQQKILAGLISQIYISKDRSAFSVVLTDGDLSHILGSSDMLTSMSSDAQAAIDDINQTQSDLEQGKTDLADLKTQHEKNLDTKIDQKDELVDSQIETQRSIADKQKSIDRLNDELSQLQGDLATVTGKSYNAKDIWDAVKFASGKTDVPVGFLMGVLKMETNLGANVGGCTYGQVEQGAEASYKAKKLGKVAWATFQRRRDLFKSITSELGLDYKSQKVSCNPKGYTGTGGAMGVAQFMPDTWIGYKSQVTSMTGHKPPSPWNLTDGVMAMALKLSRTPGVTAGKKTAMKSAACSYLGTCYAPYINGILYWADNYKDLLN